MLCAGRTFCRDLTAVAEIASQVSWAGAMLGLPMKANASTDKAAGQGKKSLSPQQRGRIAAAYDKIVEDAIAANPDPLLRGRMKRTKLEGEGFNLAVAFRDHEAEILRFCGDLRIPLTNNQGERDLWMAKLRQKISGGFRTPEGAESFCKVRSYISPLPSTEWGLLRPHQALPGHSLGHPRRRPGLIDQGHQASSWQAGSRRQAAAGVQGGRGDRLQAHPAEGRLQTDSAHRCLLKHRGRLAGEPAARHPSRIRSLTPRFDGRAPLGETTVREREMGGPQPDNGRGWGT